MAEIASAIKLIDGSKRGVRAGSKNPVDGSVTANKWIAETICGHSAHVADATPRLFVCRVDMVPPTALIADNSKSRENFKREIDSAFGPHKRI
jgi:hypothetical protein